MFQNLQLSPTSLKVLVPNAVVQKILEHETCGKSPKISAKVLKYLSAKFTGRSGKSRYTDGSSLHLLTKLKYYKNSDKLPLTAILDHCTFLILLSQRSTMRRRPPPNTKTNKNQNLCTFRRLTSNSILNKTGYKQSRNITRLFLHNRVKLDCGRSLDGKASSLPR